MAKDFAFNNVVPRPHLLLAGDVVDILRGSGAFQSGDAVIRKAVSVGVMNPDYFSRQFNAAATGSNPAFHNQAAISFDGVFSPYSVATHAKLPYFEAPTDNTNPNSLTLNPFNPNNILPTGDNRNEWNSGHNITMAMVATGIGIEGDPEDFAFDKDFFLRSRVETQQIRGVGLRSPQVMVGWGFDTAGNPVPADTGDATKFHPNAFWDPNLWKAGPIDLRWDNTRKVWRGGGDATIYLVKTTNVYNPAGFSYEVDRSTGRSQYARPSLSYKANSTDDDTIHDPEKIAYDLNSDNGGNFERLDFTNAEYPHYEAYIIRDTDDTVTSSTYYNLWTDDCPDCGHISNPCTSGTNTVHGSASANKKILIENPLRQSLDIGDLAYTVNTNRTKKVNTGSFTGGNGTGAAISLTTDASGVLSATIDASGAGYINGAFGIVSGNICTAVTISVGGRS